MKSLSQHIEHVKGKPHHIRKRVAFGAAASGTAVIALVWLFASLGTGAFALKPTSFADSAGGGALTVSSDGGSVPATSAVAGVGAAGAPEDTGAARIMIVDTTVAATSSRKAERTTIPF